MKETKKRSHKITEKLPLLAIVIWIVFAIILEVVMSSLFGSFGLSDGTEEGIEMVSNISSIIVSILLMIIMKAWYSPEYKGTLKSGLTIKLTLLAMTPLILKSVVVLIVQLFQYSFWFDPSLFKLIKSLAAGFLEEALFRVTIIPIAMGFMKNEKRIWYIPLISGLIFGAMHMLNISSGATVANGITQAVVTALDGFYFGALFVATGSAFPGIILHSVYDFICFAGDRSLDNGIMAAPLQTWEIIFNVVITLIVFAGGVMLLKKVGKNKIFSVWKKKWSQEAAAIQGEM